MRIEEKKYATAYVQEPTKDTPATANTYYKPQAPIKYGSSKYIYPLTTADQVVVDNGERLNIFLKNAVFQDLTGITIEPMRRQSNDSGTTVAVRDDINSNDVQVARLVAVLK